MWILSVIPDAWMQSVLHGIIILSLVGFIAGLFLKKIPFIQQYGIIIVSVSFILLLGGIYFEGSYNTEKKWTERVAEMQEQVRAAEAKSAKVNTVVVEKIIVKKQIIKQKGAEIIKYVDREIVKYDNICPVPAEVVKALNAAAINEAIDKK